MCREMKKSLDPRSFINQWLTIEMDINVNDIEANVKSCLREARHIDDVFKWFVDVYVRKKLEGRAILTHFSSQLITRSIWSGVAEIKGTANNKIVTSTVIMKSAVEYSLDTIDVPLDRLWPSSDCSSRLAIFSSCDIIKFARLLFAQFYLGKCLSSYQC